MPPISASPRARATSPSGLRRRRPRTRISSTSPAAWTPACAPRRSAHRHMIATVEQNAPSAGFGQRNDDRPRAGRRDTRSRLSNWRSSLPAAPASTAPTGWSGGSATSRARATTRCSRDRKRPMPGRWRSAFPSTGCFDSPGSCRPAAWTISIVQAATALRKRYLAARPSAACHFRPPPASILRNDPDMNRRFSPAHCEPRRGR